MSPRWAEVAGYGLYFYSKERHRRPHVDVQKGGEGAVIDLVTGEILVGELPPAMLRRVRKLIEQHREEALQAFRDALEHQEPGKLDRKETGDE